MTEMSFISSSVSIENVQISYDNFLSNFRPPLPLYDGILTFLANPSPPYDVFYQPPPLTYTVNRENCILSFFSHYKLYDDLANPLPPYYGTLTV